MAKAKTEVKKVTVKKVKATSVKPAPKKATKPTEVSTNKKQRSAKPAINKKPAPKKKAVKKKDKGGRPTSYRKDYAEQARKLCLLYATDDGLANFFGVTEKTINNWKRDHPEFLQSIKAGKELADAEITDRLAQRALGFEHDSEEIKILKDKNGLQKVVRVKTRKIYAPDSVAAIFWLKNRQSKRWRDKQEVEHTGNDRPYEEMTDEELEAEIAKRGGN